MRNFGFLTAVLLVFNNLVWAADTNLDKTIGAVVVIDQKHGLPCPDITNYLWDNIRRARFNLINNKSTFCCDSAYDNLYIVTGRRIRNFNYMKKIWKKAQKNNDIIDYFSFVHGPQQYIKEQWGVTKHSGKLRYAHSEACKGGHGAEHFIKHYGFIISSGHKKDTCGNSASPYFTFGVIKNWISGENLPNTMQNTWDSTKETLYCNNYNLKGLLAQRIYWPIAKTLGRSQNREELFDVSQLEFAWRADLDINNFDFYSILPTKTCNNYYTSTIKLKAD